YGLSQTSSTRRAIEYLINLGVIYKYKNKYYFEDPFFKSFLLDYAD
ncbi:MAG: hypothetical protein QG635_686, partial [Bacteroidota bacterium]|nr:hypothetical protein [Bacteroidota bacterium]